MTRASIEPCRAVLPLLTPVLGHHCMCCWWCAAVIVESTYGVSRHGPREARERAFLDKVVSTVTRKGRVLIPIVAIGRAQVGQAPLGGRGVGDTSMLARQYRVPVCFCSWAMITGALLIRCYVAVKGLGGSGLHWFRSGVWCHVL